ncbi:aldehyde dehydrogenase family protein [Pseudonocardia acidicola]|uniref:Aldehyde dehydrogenase family protein n=1 Tax=Pseudonocardia acidicola TaxID=2724939 RepID=A0ABX1SIE1_9PSEU|nr:aldehyde dehydrogenase family protein [Pseudonocardia acidicola]NMI00710.1 aldehyde dehydrogenase family protein [Pseudonocardia acidicola]
MTRLHIFDMDGTLLRGAASVELSRYLGTFEAANAVEEAWLRGEISDVQFWERVLPLWEGISEEEIDAVDDLDVGVLHADSETAGADPHVPFGGAKHSGYGPKEQGRASREFFTHTTTVYLRGGRPG